MFSLFDSWAGCLSVQDYAKYVYPYVKQIIDSIEPTVPVINFATGNPALLPLLRGDSRTVVGIDWRIPLDDAWRTVGYDRPVQGKPRSASSLRSHQDTSRDGIRCPHACWWPRRHIFNLGHGILQQTDVNQVIALVDMVHEMSAK